MIMYNKAIQFTRHDGGVSVIHLPAVIKYAQSALVVTDKVVEDEALRVVPSGTPYQIVDRDAIPTDRTYRGAWVIDGRTIKGDVEKAKAIALARKRKTRDELLLQEDKKEQIAQRQGGTGVAAIHVEKDRLCACTDNVKGYTCSEGRVANLATLAAELLPLEEV